ncbi:hypothetical protein Bca52824_032287 [Brassica carinata]|uniref:Uncharacterized protein n=1 Tax=Brassica carinata TaxID=52824 RepID=A0A8X7V8I2_BRACI|nr:hypothetical protein Bca52824_032287 [Brassica carinata]
MQHDFVMYSPKICRQAGHCSSTLEVRLLIFWKARKVKRGGELMGVHMLLLDVKISISNNGGPTVFSGVKLESIRKSYKGVTVLKTVTEEFMCAFKEEIELTEKLENSEGY